MAEAKIKNAYASKLTNGSNYEMLLTFVLLTNKNN